MPGYESPMNWQTLALVSAFFAGLTAVLGKLGVAGADSDAVTLVRTVVVLALIAVILTVRGTWGTLATLPSANYVFLVASGLTTGLSWLAYYRALQLGPASRVAPLEKSSILLAVLLAGLVLHEPLGWRTLAGAALILGGGWLLVV